MNRGRLESYGVARDERNETTSYGEDRSSEVTSERSSVQITSVVPFLVHLLTTFIPRSTRSFLTSFHSSRRSPLTTRRRPGSAVERALRANRTGPAARRVDERSEGTGVRHRQGNRR